MQQLQEEEGIKSKTLDDKPELFPDLYWAWDIFDFLNRQRQVGMNGPQPIAVSDLYASIQLLQVNTEEASFLVRVIPQLDSVYLSDFYKQQEKRTSNKNNNKGKRR